jgi:O-antigen/teichoic acid export membrane protein
MAMPETTLPVNRVLGHLRLPVYSRAYALILSSASTSVLGFLYWTLAARLYSPRDLGINAALISTMMFLSYVAQLGLAGALPRFIPTAGRATRRLIVGAYGVSVMISAVIATVFILGCGLWAPELQSMLNTPAGAAWFLAATMAWSLFALQDAALTGLKRTVWVPIENTIFAVVKVVLLVALAASLAGSGIYVSWTIPAALSVVPINILIFRWFLPDHAARHAQTEPEGGVGLIARYLVSDYGGSLLVSGSSSLLPLIVLATAGAQANAYYYIAWTVAYSMQMFSVNMGTSLSVEGGAEGRQLAAALRRMLRLLVALQLPLVVVIATLSPFILQIFGSRYSDEGAMLLRLLILGILPHGLNAVCLGVARVRRQLRVLFAVQAGQAGLFLALVVVLLPALGIAGVGLAFLVAQSAVAAVALTTQILPLLRAEKPAPPIESGPVSGSDAATSVPSRPQP